MQQSVCNFWSYYLTVYFVLYVVYSFERIYCIFVLCMFMVICKWAYISNYGFAAWRCLVIRCTFRHFRLLFAFYWFTIYCNSVYWNCSPNMSVMNANAIVFICFAITLECISITRCDRNAHTFIQTYTLIHTYRLSNNKLGFSCTSMWCWYESVDRIEHPSVERVIRSGFNIKQWNYSTIYISSVCVCVYDLREKNHNKINSTWNLKNSLNLPHIFMCTSQRLNIFFCSYDFWIIIFHFK